MRPLVSVVHGRRELRLGVVPPQRRPHDGGRVRRRRQELHRRGRRQLVRPTARGVHIEPNVSNCIPNGAGDGGADSVAGRMSEQRSRPERPNDFVRKRVFIISFAFLSVEIIAET